MTNVLVSPKHQKLLIRYDPAVANIAPHAIRKRDYLLLDHGRQETRLLRNLGYDAPAPILSQYDWCRTVPFESQRQTAALLTMNARAYVLNTMGTGKTRASLFAADFLMSTPQVRKCLVIAPLSTLTPTWMNEIFRFFHHRKAVVLHGSKAKRRKLLAEDVDFYIINHDGVQTILPELEARGDIDCVIVDELASLRDASTDKYKIIKKVIIKRPYVWGLTGAPTPNAPTDAYAQIKLLQPNKLGTFTRFRDATMYKLTQFKWLPRAQAADYVHKHMQPSVRYTLEDCVDIPETTYSTRQLKPSPQQEDFYKKLDDAASAAFLDHKITAANEGVVRNKLMQVSCGYVYTDDKRVLGLNPSAKLAEVRAILTETDRKVIIFVPYTHALVSVAQMVAKVSTVETIYGGVNRKERDRIFYEFQNSSTPRTIVADARTMSHGLTLTESNTIVWFAPPAGLDTYIQANARIVRTSQEHKTNIIHLQSTRVEREAYKRLQNNESLQNLLLDMYEGVDDRS